MKTILLTLCLVVGAIWQSQAQTDHSGEYRNPKTGVVIYLEQAGNDVAFTLSTDGFEHEAAGTMISNPGGQKAAELEMKRTDTSNGCETYARIKLTFLSPTRIKLQMWGKDNNCDLTTQYYEESTIVKVQ